MQAEKRAMDGNVSNKLALAQERPPPPGEPIAEADSDLAFLRSSTNRSLDQ